MKNSNSIIDVTRIIRDFLENEAKTIEISRGKLVEESRSEDVWSKYLKVG